jgi:hypothetical protein
MKDSSTMEQWINNTARFDQCVGFPENGKAFLRSLVATSLLRKGSALTRNSPALKYESPLESGQNSYKNAAPVLQTYAVEPRTVTWGSCQTTQNAPMLVAISATGVPETAAIGIRESSQLTCDRLQSARNRLQNVSSRTQFRDSAQPSSLIHDAAFSERKRPCQYNRDSLLP